MPQTATKILSHQQIQQKINRIATEIYENNFQQKEVIIVGIANRGYKLAERIDSALKELTPLKTQLLQLKIDKRDPLKEKSETSFEKKVISGKVIILVDDVLNTGRTLAYGVKQLLEFPLKRLVTVVLVNRRHRLYPIRADYVGLTLATTLQEHIDVRLEPNKDSVYLK